MALTTKSFSTLVNEAQATIQGKAALLIDMTVGSILLAVTQAFSATVLWLQAQILLVLAYSRASGSNGSDLDSWMADFGVVKRLPPVPATSTATFSRYTDTNGVFVYPTAVLAESAGVITVTGTAAIETQDGANSYGIYPDPTNAFWNATVGAYYFPALTAGGDLPIVSMTSGTSGNALAGTVNTLVSSLPGIDTVVNSADIRNGADAETDQALRARFQLAISALSEGTITAITNAVLGVQDNLSCLVVENRDYATDDVLYGVFYVMVDDGTGILTAPLHDALVKAILAVKPVSVVLQDVYEPTVITPTVAMTIVVASGYDKPTMVAAVTAALTAYIESLRTGDGLTITRLAQVSYDTSPGIVNVTSIALAGSGADIAPAPKTHINPGTITVTPA